MQYYQGLKIEEAKCLLGKKESITAVSENLSFENPQYFAKVFKQRTGKTPTEYRNQIDKVAERDDRRAEPNMR
jgi:two-component system response regulator YesN